MIPRLNMGYAPASGVTREIVVKYDMRVEVAPAYFDEALAEVRDLVGSVHLPWNEADLGRLKLLDSFQVERNQQHHSG